MLEDAGLVKQDRVAQARPRRLKPDALTPARDAAKKGDRATLAAEGEGAEVIDLAP